jgi:hypothetical protein
MATMLPQLQSFGGGLGRGIGASILQALQEQQKQQQAQKQYQDIVSVLQGMGFDTGQLEAVNPQTAAASQALLRQTQPYTLAPGHQRMIGDRIQAYNKPVQKPGKKVKVTAYKNGKAIPLMIPEKGYNQYIQALRRQGYTFDKEDEGGPLVELYNPQNPDQVRTLRRDSPFVDKLLDKGWLEVQRGMSIEQTPGGGLRVQTGTRANQNTMGSKAQNTLESKSIEAREGLARLYDITGKFKEEFQTIPTRLNIAWDELKEKAGKDISSKEKERIAEFSKYKRSALDYINRYIKAITGAQMSEAEANRLRKGVPDAGEGIFGGDSPTTFKAKLRDSIKVLTMANARYNYWLKYPEKAGSKYFVSLDEMPDVIETQGARIERNIEQKNPGLSQEEVDRKVKEELQKIFGIPLGQ